MMAQAPSDAKEKAEEIAQAKPKAKLFEDISVGVDLFGIANKFFSNEADYQASVQANLKGIFLPVVELGYGTADKYYDESLTTFKSNGMFGRIGCDYNILKKKLDDYKFTVGLRYGLSRFNYETTMPTDTIPNPEFATLKESCTVHWAELVLGVKVRVSGPFFMGWSVRYRRRLGCSEYVNPPIYAPGYGNASNTTNFMATYTIGLMF